MLVWAIGKDKELCKKHITRSKEDKQEKDGGEENNGEEIDGEENNGEEIDGEEIIGDDDQKWSHPQSQQDFHYIYL